MDIKEGFFDSIIDAHGMPLLNDPEDLYYFMRGYINFRLLFWPCVYFTDATINNNSALRYLMFEQNSRVKNAKYPYLPRDYNMLLKNGVFRVAVRDTLSPYKFSSELRTIQKSNKNSSIPPQKYTELIEGAIDYKSSILRFSLDQVSQLFTNKVHDYLRLNSLQNDELSILCCRLNDNIGKNKKVNFNELLGWVVNYGYGPDTPIYAEIKNSVAQCYKNNVPEVLGLNNQYLYEKVAGTTLESVRGIRIPRQIFTFNSAFDLEFLTYLPSTIIVDALGLTERARFIKQLNSALNGENIDQNKIYASFERYVRQLDGCFKDYYQYAQKRKLLSIQPDKNKHIIIKIYESDTSRIIQLAMETSVGFASAIAGAVLSVLHLILDQFIIPKIDVTKNKAQKDLGEAQFLAILSEKSVITQKPSSCKIINEENGTVR